MTVQEQTSAEIVIASGIFDLPHYAQQVGGNFSSIEDGIAHYLEQGHLKNLDPHPLFDTSFYLQSQPDVAKAGANPLLHYILQGGFENRKPSELFDSYYYLSENADVKALRVNPLSHFILTGSEQGRNPSAVFDTTFYVTANPEVKESNLNPLVHYVTRGKSEGRRPNSRPLYPRDLYLKMRRHEPLLPPFAALQTLRESRESFVSNSGLVYGLLKEKINALISHLYVVSNDVASLQIAQSLASAQKEANSHSQPLIIVSGRRRENIDSAIAEISTEHQVLEIQNFGKKLEAEQELQIICRLAIQAEPEIIHAVNSQICFELFKRLHKPLSLKSKLCASISAFTLDAEGVPAGPNLYLSACADALSAILRR